MNNVTIDDLKKEQKRFNNYLLFYYIRLGILLVFAITMFLILATGAVDIFDYMLVIFVILLCFTFFYRPHVKQKKKYLATYKKCFINNILSKYCNNIEFNENDGIPYSVIYEPGIIVKSGEYYSNNLISGIYKNIPFTIADIYLKDYRRRGYMTSKMLSEFVGHETKTRNNKTVTEDIANLGFIPLLNGNWMCFEFNKNFKEKISIIEKGFSNIKEYNRIKNNDYSKKYYFICDDENNLNSFITPELIEKIDKLRNKVNSNILLSIYDNKLHIGFDNFKNFLNPSKKIDLMNNSLQDNIKLLFDIVEYIQNNDVYFK